MSTHYTTFLRLVIRLKSLLAKNNLNRLSQDIFQTLALIKEHGELSDKNLLKIHEATGIDILDVLAEDTQWFMLDNKQLSLRL